MRGLISKPRYVWRAVTFSVCVCEALQDYGHVITLEWSSPKDVELNSVPSPVLFVGGGGVRCFLSLIFGERTFELHQVGKTTAGDIWERWLCKRLQTEREWNQRPESAAGKCICIGSGQIYRLICYVWEDRHEPGILEKEKKTIPGGSRGKCKWKVRDGTEGQTLGHPEGIKMIFVTLPPPSSISVMKLRPRAPPASSNPPASSLSCRFLHQRGSIAFGKTLLLLSAVNRTDFWAQQKLLITDLSWACLVPHARPGSPPLLRLCYLKHVDANIFAIDQRWISMLSPSMTAMCPSGAVAAAAAVLGLASCRGSR